MRFPRGTAAVMEEFRFAKRHCGKPWEGGTGAQMPEPEDLPFSPYCRKGQAPLGGRTKRTAAGKGPFWAPLVLLAFLTQERRAFLFAKFSPSPAGEREGTP